MISDSMVNVDVEFDNPDVQSMVSFIFEQALKRHGGGTRAVTGDELENLMSKLSPEDQKKVESASHGCLKIKMEEIWEAVDYLQDICAALTTISDSMAISEILKLPDIPAEKVFEDCVEAIALVQTDRLNRVHDLFAAAMKKRADLNPPNSKGTH